MKSGASRKAQRLGRCSGIRRSRVPRAHGLRVGHCTGASAHAHRRRGRARRGRGPWHDGTPTRTSQGTMRGLACAARLDTPKAGGQFGRRYVAHGPAAQPGKDVPLQPPDSCWHAPDAQRATCFASHSRATASKPSHSGLRSVTACAGVDAPCSEAAVLVATVAGPLSPTVAATIEELDALLAPGLNLRIRCR